MDLNMDQLIAEAKKIGHDEIPIGSAGSSEAVSALDQVFEACPGQFFKAKELQAVLNKNGIECSKIGNVLFQMKNARKCSQVKKGVYTSYDSKYDGNMTSSNKTEGE